MAIEQGRDRAQPFNGFGEKLTDQGQIFDVPLDTLMYGVVDGQSVKMELVDALASALGIPFSSVGYFPSRAAAVSGVANLPASIIALLTMESGNMVLRSRASGVSDPLIPGAWGVMFISTAQAQPTYLYGGATGQVLVKGGNADLDFDWANPQQIVDASTILAVDVQMTGGGSVEDSVIEAKETADSAKTKTPYTFGAVGNGSSNDSSAVLSSIEETAEDYFFFSTGDYLSDVSSTEVPSNSVIQGQSNKRSSLKRRNSGNFVRSTDTSGIVIKSVAINANRGSLGDVSGHAMTFSGTSNLTLGDVEVTSFGTTISGSGGGTGVLFSGSVANPRTTRPRLLNSTIIADPTSGVTIGWIMDDSDFGYANGVYVKDTTSGLGWAHELKTRAYHNLMLGLQSENSNIAFGLGGEQTQSDGGNYNLWSALVAKNTRTGYAQSKGKGNLVSAMLVDDLVPATEARDEVVGIGLTYLSGVGSSAEANAIVDVMGFGNRARFAAIGGSRNYVRGLVHTVGTVVRFASNAVANVMEVLHPGARGSVAGAVIDESGQPLDGSNANVVRSDATGERIGSISGWFHDQLSRAGVTWNAEHRWRKERQNIAIQAFGTDGTSGNQTGIAVAVPSDANRAGVLHQLGPDAAGDRWAIRGFGQGEVFTLDISALSPTRDAGDAQSRFKDLGKQTLRWVNGYITRLRPGSGAVIWTAGTGAPNGSVTAPVGSLYTREDGAAGATLYVKETGTGNTGWVAK